MAVRVVWLGIDCWLYVQIEGIHEMPRYRIDNIPSGREVPDSDTLQNIGPGSTEVGSRELALELARLQHLHNQHQFASGASGRTVTVTMIRRWLWLADKVIWEMSV